MGRIRHGAAWVIAVALQAQPVSGRDFNDPLILYADSATPNVVRSRACDGGAWGSSSAIGTLSGNLAQLDLVRRLKGDRDLLLAVDTNGSLTAFTATEGAWGSGATLCSNVGTSYLVVSAAVRESRSGDALLVYRSGASSSPRYRTYSAGVMSSESTFSMGLPGAPDHVVLASRAGSNEIVLLARSGGTVAAAWWDGAAFGSSSTLSTTASTFGRAMDAAVESASGEALAVWSDGSRLRYSARVGGTWSVEANVVNPTGNIQCARLAANPLSSSDGAIVVYSTSTGEIASKPWTGSAWGRTQSLDSTGFTGFTPRFDAAWQSDGTRAVVAWARNGSGLVRSRTWNGTSWSSESSGPTLGANLERIRLTPASTTGDIIAACQLKPATTSVGDLLLYSGTSISLGSTTVHGEYASSPPALSLPSSPGSSVGTTDLTYGNNATATIAPGSYRDWTFGNSCTFSLSAGTYRFRSMSTDKNTLTINCDTSRGDISLIVTTGNVQPKNNCTITSTGGGVTTIHVLGGDFAPREATLTGVNVIVYAGGVSSSSNLTVSGTVWASGAVSLNNGDFHGNPDRRGSGGALQAFVYSSGVAGSIFDAASACQGTAPADCFEASWAPAASQARITRWRETSRFDR